MSKIRAKWAKRVALWAESGLTAREYAAQIGVNQQTLANWKYKLAGEKRAEQGEGSTSPTRLDFLEVATVAANSVPIELVLPEGEVIRVPVGFEAETLTQLLDVLETRR